MKAAAVLLACALCAGSARAEDRTPIRASIDRAAATLAEPDTAQPSVGRGGHGALFWSGLAVGIAGATTAILGVTVARTESRSTGNAPDNTYSSCVALKSNPVYAGSDCDALKGPNGALLWSGAALGAVGAVMMIHSVNTSAEIGPGVIRVARRIRF